MSFLFFFLVCGDLLSRFVFVFGAVFWGGCRGQLFCLFSVPFLFLFCVLLRFWSIGRVAKCSGGGGGNKKKKATPVFFATKPTTNTIDAFKEKDD